MVLVLVMVLSAFFDEWCHNLAMAYESLTETEYPQFEAILMDGNNDAEKQINAIDSLLQQDLDYIVMHPLPGVEPALLKIQEAGYPVICVDTVPKSDELVWTQIGVDEAEFGRMQATKLAEVLPENGTVGIAMNSLGSNSQINRTAGFEEKIAELRPDVTIIDKQAVDSNTAKAMNLVEDWLQRFGPDGINAIVCQSAMGVQGVVECLKAHDLIGKVYVAAQDFTQPSGTEWLKSGATIVDVFYDYNALVRGTYDTILAYEAGADMPAQVMINPSVWTIDNCDEFGK
jgi:ribose transport system substrate-binding protein